MSGFENQNNQDVLKVPEQPVCTTETAEAQFAKIDAEITKKDNELGRKIDSLFNRDQLTTDQKLQLETRISEIKSLVAESLASPANCEYVAKAQNALNELTVLLSDLNSAAQNNGIKISDTEMEHVVSPLEEKLAKQAAIKEIQSLTAKASEAVKYFMPDYSSLSVEEMGHFLLALNDPDVISNLEVEYKNFQSIKRQLQALLTVESDVNQSMTDDVSKLLQLARIAIIECFQQNAGNVYRLKYAYKAVKQYIQNPYALEYSFLLKQIGDKGDQADLTRAERKNGDGLVPVNTANANLQLKAILKQIVDDEQNTNVADNR